jgi:hypothetical protein
MSNLLSQLENNEAVLMLYLAGELPQEDCIEVQRMLERDKALRAQYVAIGRLMDGAALSFGMDAAMDTPADADHARQRISPVFRQWTAQRLSRPVAQARTAARSTPWLFYPLGAAAAILVGLAVFWSNVSPTTSNLLPRGELTCLPDFMESAGESTAEPNPLEVSRQADALIATFDDNSQLTGRDSADLLYAVNELNQIREVDQQVGATLPMLQ